MLSWCLPLPEILGAQQLQEWHVEPNPSVIIDDRIGERGEFTRISGAVRLSDGSIAVIGLGTQDIRVFSSGGVFVRAYGRKGAGPGEYEYPRYFARAGDTLFIYDHTHQRITTLDARSGNVRTEPVRRVPSGELDPMARLASGEVLSAPIPVTSMRRPDGLMRYRINVYLAPPDSSRSPTLLGEFPWLTSLAINPENRELARAVGTYPFGPQLHLESAGNLAVLGDAAEPALQFFDRNGRAVARVALPLDARPFDRAQIVRMGAEAVRNASTEQARTAFRARHDPRYLPERQPYFRALHAGPNGEIWVERYRADVDGPAEFVVVSATRTVLARVRAPVGMSVFDIGVDYMLGVQTDADGVERVVMHRISR